MKTKYNIILFFIFFISGSFYVNAQNCGKKELCAKEAYGKDFDYRSQSSFAILAPGDTARASIVVYSKTMVRILVCNDPILGVIEFKLYHPNRKMRKVVDEIITNEEEIEIYKKDANGNPIPVMDDWEDPPAPMMDEYGDTIYEVERTETVVSFDTTYREEEYLHEELIYDSSKDPADKPYWEQVIGKTKRLIVEVIVPVQEGSTGDDDADYNAYMYGEAAVEGCVNVRVGRKSARAKKKFQRM